LAWPSDTLLSIKTRSAFATGHFSESLLDPLHKKDIQSEYGVWNTFCAKKNTQQKILIENNQACDVYHIPAHTSFYSSFAFDDYISFPIKVDMTCSIYH
jgi:hypothetical protein